MKINSLVKNSLLALFLLCTSAPLYAHVLQDSWVKNSQGNWVSSGGAYDDSFAYYNCYAYAIEKPVSSDQSPPAHTPGNFSSGGYYPTIPLENLTWLVEADLKSFGYNVWVDRVEPTNLAPGQSLICVRTGSAPNRLWDYHFMRKNFDDGYWYHKPADSAILKYKYHPAYKSWISEISKKRCRIVGCACIQQ